MAAPLPRAFISFSHRDDEYARRYARRLRALGVDVWYDEINLMAGQEFARVIDTELNSRPVFILLISPASIASPWVNREAAFALHMGTTDRERIFLPVLAAPTPNETIPAFWQVFQRIAGPGHEPLPPDVAAVETARALGISTGSVAPAVEAPSPVPVPQSESDVADAVAHLLQQGDTYREENYYEEALEQYEQAIALAPQVDSAWALKGTALAEMHRYEEAVEAFAEALRRNPTLLRVWQTQATLLKRLQRNEQALAACDRALALDAESAYMWVLKGNSLWGLRRYADAASAYDSALATDPASLGDMTKSVRALIRRLH